MAISPELLLELQSLHSHQQQVLALIIAFLLFSLFIFSTLIFGLYSLFFKPVAPDPLLARLLV